MKQKQAIRYLRISADRQSNWSIGAQDDETRRWCERNNVRIIDTFTDDGYSACTHDRPDLNKLNAFIAKHHREVDFLVVNTFDRFSRNSGEALIQIQKLQYSYHIKVVSVTEAITFDADDPGSFFYTGLMLLKAEDEIKRNRMRIHQGIYSAIKKEGRYLGTAPYGYKNTRDEMNRPVIVPNDETAPVVRFIFFILFE